MELLASTSGWHRETAHRLLIERQDRSVIPQLREMAKTNASPVARVNALWVLESLSALDDRLVLTLSTIRIPEYGNTGCGWPSRFWTNLRQSPTPPWQ